LFNSLSGRFLFLTIIFVMLAEVLIFVPSVARFREDYLLERLERAQIASLALLATDGMITDELEAELLLNAEVLNVVLRRDEVRQLILSGDEMPMISRTYDLRDATAMTLIRDALVRLVVTDEEVIRVIGAPIREAGLQIEVTMPSAPLRAAILDYGLNILLLSAVISIFTAALLFFAVRRLLVAPIGRVVTHMIAYAEAPEDARLIIVPQARVTELRSAETALQSLQTQLTSALRQRERLAQLGEAVAKISHDLRNILTVATLMADRLEGVDDPTVKRTAPKLISSLSRAVSLCEGTLAFGKAEEPPPSLDRVDLAQLIEDVAENERLVGMEVGVLIKTDVEIGIVARADPEQLYRVLNNLVRNACQAITASGKDGSVTIRAETVEDGWAIWVCDTGPGLPPKAVEHLFTPFQGGFRKGGIGLGLAIAAELIKGHGGRLELSETGQNGTTFHIFLPGGVRA
jgi:signal transduction histidine kinase